MTSQMKKLFLTEFDTSDKTVDYPVHLTIDGAGNDNTATWGYILKNCTSMNSPQFFGICVSTGLLTRSEFYIDL